MVLRVSATNRSAWIGGLFVLLGASALLMAGDAEAQTETYYFHSLAKQGNVEGISDYNVPGPHPFPMDTTPPADPVSATVHPSGVDGTTAHNKYYDVAEWATTTDVALSGDNITLHVWIAHGPAGSAASQALDMEWEINLYRDEAATAFRTETVNIGPVLPGPMLVSVNITDVTMAAGRLSVHLDPLFVDSGADHLILYDSTVHDSRLEIHFPVPGGGGPPPVMDLEVDAQGDYEGPTGTTHGLDSLITGGVPPYICRWSGPDEVLFYDPSACDTPAKASPRGDYNLTLEVWDQEGRYGRDWTWLNVTDERRDAMRGNSGPGSSTDRDAGAANAGSSSGGSRERLRIGGDDRDLDGVTDTGDNCPDRRNPSQDDAADTGRGDACDTDPDGDGIHMGVDNCPWTWNPIQVDRDGDGTGDACIEDDDDDGVADGTDNCRWAADIDTRNTDQADLDADGRGDVCDKDRDGDGVPDKKDAFPLDARESADTEGDGIGDAADRDDDNDGFSDREELAAGTDPLNGASRPREIAVLDVHDASPAPASMGPLGSASLLAALVIVGVVLFVLLRPRD